MICIDMDMPKKCSECPCSGEIDYYNYTVLCRVDKEIHSFFDDRRPKTCPLKECE